MLVWQEILLLYPIHLQENKRNNIPVYNAHNIKQQTYRGEADDGTKSLFYGGFASSWLKLINQQP